MTTAYPISCCVECGTVVLTADSDAYLCSKHSGTGKPERVSDVAEDDDAYFGPTPVAREDRS